MARHDYLPSGDAAFDAFCDNFGRLVQLTPGPFQLTEALATAYVGKVEDYRAKLQASLDPATRGKRTVFLKQEAKKGLVRLTRQYAQQINKLLNISDEQRQALGLTIADTHRTPSPIPIEAPFLKVLKVDGRTATIELTRGKAGRGKPSKVHGATILTAIGEDLPASTMDWTFSQNTTRTTVEVAFASSATGDTVHITAFWNNSRDESGPAARPITLNLPAGGVKATAPQAMKLAA